MSDYIISPNWPQILISAEVQLAGYAMNITSAIQIQEKGIPGSYPVEYFPTQHQPQIRLKLEQLVNEFPAITKCL